jgi:hypothetical protein
LYGFAGSVAADFQQTINHRVQINISSRISHRLV